MARTPKAENAMSVTVLVFVAAAIIWLVAMVQVLRESVQELEERIEKLEKKPPRPPLIQRQHQTRPGFRMNAEGAGGLLTAD